MLDIKFIKENRELVEATIKNKNIKEDINIDLLLELSEKRKNLRQKIDEINTKRNEAAKAHKIEEGKQLKEEIVGLETEFTEVDKNFMQIMLKIPNMASADTPIGPDESHNVIIKEVGEKPKFDFTPLAHWDIGKKLDVIDNERATLVSGARFTYIKGDLALLQLALINFAVSIVTDEEKLKAIIAENNLNVSSKPFSFVFTPDMIKPAVLNRMARLDPKEDKYYIESDDVYLAGSAEHALGPMHMDEIIKREDMPLRYLGYSTAFRREAGSYGKDTKGILRMHQFDKLELESFSLPEESKAEQDLFVAIQEHMMQKLRLPYRVVLLCTGDMGGPDYRHIDIETWMPGQNVYRETHSADLMTSFQSRRLNIKYKNAEGKTEYVHMNDATLFALGRTLIAIIENYQQADGSVKIPEVLVPYLNKEFIKKD